MIRISKVFLSPKVTVSRSMGSASTWGPKFFRVSKHRDGTGVTFLGRSEKLGQEQGKVVGWLCCCLVVSDSFCDPRDCSPPGSSVRGILAAKILE